MRTTLLISLALGALQSAQAGLILDGTDVIGGAGFGAIPRILTVQATGNASTESGCDAWSGSGLLVGPAACTSANAGGNEANPQKPPKDSAPTLSSVGFDNASEVGIVFDATQPGSNNTLTMDSLILKFYSPTGQLLLSEPLDNPPLDLTKLTTGNGKTDLLFTLDMSGINQVQSIIYSQPGALADHIALETTMSAVHGGPESFLAQAQVNNLPSCTVNCGPPPCRNNCGPSTVPEPSSMGLVGLGLCGAAIASRRFNNRKQGIL